MLTIPLYSFLFIYFIFLAIFVAFSIMNFYHVVMTASFTFASFIITFFIFTLTVLTLYFTYTLLVNVDWQTTTTVINPGWFGNSGPENF